MNIHRFSTAVLLAVIACFTFAAGFAVPAKAQTGINVTPTRIDSTIAIGDETTEMIRLSNSSAGDIEVEARIEPPAPDRGAASIAVDPGKVLLRAGESTDMMVRIAVPADAAPESQEGAITFNVVAVSGAAVTIVGEVRTAVALNVIKPVSDAEFSYPLIAGGPGPLVFTMKGRNTSEFPARITGDVELKALLGEDVVLHRSSGQISNDETFEMQAVWEDPPLFGIRKMTIRLNSGVGVPETKTAYMLIFSWKLMLAIIFLAAAAILMRRKCTAIFNVFRTSGDNR